MNLFFTLEDFLLFPVFSSGFPREFQGFPTKFSTTCLKLVGNGIQHLGVKAGLFPFFSHIYGWFSLLCVVFHILVAFHKKSGLEFSTGKIKAVWRITSGILHLAGASCKQEGEEANFAPLPHFKNLLKKVLQQDIFNFLYS